MTYLALALFCIAQGNTAALLFGKDDHKLARVAYAIASVAGNAVAFAMVAG